MLLHLLAAVVPARERRLCVCGDVFSKRKVVYRSKGREATVNGSPHLGAVIAAPVENREDIDDAVTGFKMSLHASGQRAGRVCQHYLVLFGRVQPQMTARHHPQDAVVVERDVPLDVARASFDDVIDIALERRSVDGGEDRGATSPGRGPGRDCTSSSSL